MYRAAAQCKYNKKCRSFAFVYSPVDAKEGDRLAAYCKATGQTLNSYIKATIKADLDSKGIGDDGLPTQKEA